jgi:hypothetical protein
MGRRLPAFALLGKQPYGQKEISPARIAIQGIEIRRCNRP